MIIDLNLNEEFILKKDINKKINKKEKGQASTHGPFSKGPSVHGPYTFLLVDVVRPNIF